MHGMCEDEAMTIFCFFFFLIYFLLLGIDLKNTDVNFEKHLRGFIGGYIGKDFDKT